MSSSIIGMEPGDTAEDFEKKCAKCGHLDDDHLLAVCNRCLCGVRSRKATVPYLGGEITIFDPRVFERQ